jgi:hypothetical protein
MTRSIVSQRGVKRPRQVSDTETRLERPIRARKVDTLATRRRALRACATRTFSRSVYEGFEEADAVADSRRLLRRGSVMRSLAPSQHPAWRRAIRAAARADALSVRTWLRDGRPGEVRAVLQGLSLTPDERERFERGLGWLRED